MLDRHALVGTDLVPAKAFDEIAASSHNVNYKLRLAVHPTPRTGATLDMRQPLVLGTEERASSSGVEEGGQGVRGETIIEG